MTLTILCTEIKSAQYKFCFVKLKQHIYFRVTTPMPLVLCSYRYLLEAPVPRVPRLGQC